MCEQEGKVVLKRVKWGWKYCCHGRTWEQMANLDAKVDLEILTWTWKS